MQEKSSVTGRARHSLSELRVESGETFGFRHQGTVCMRRPVLPQGYSDRLLRRRPGLQDRRRRPVEWYLKELKGVPLSVTTQQVMEDTALRLGPDS